MKLEKIIEKFIKYPKYMEMGAGKLSNCFKCTREEIYIARAEARKAIKPIQKNKKILILDIETSPLRSYTWGRWKQNIGLNQTISEWFMLSWSAKWLDSIELMGEGLTPEEVLNEDDLRITTSIWKLIDEADVVIAHNGIKFDLPKLNSRFILNGLIPPSPYTQIDTLKIAQRNFGFSSNKLDALAKYFGIPMKLDTTFELWADCMKGSQSALKKMLEYNKHDVVILEEVYHRLLPWVKSHPNMALVYDDVIQRCPSCGGNNLIELEDKFYYTTVGKYPVYRCKKCKSLSRGRKTITNYSKNKFTLTSIAK